MECILLSLHRDSFASWILFVAQCQDISFNLLEASWMLKKSNPNFAKTCLSCWHVAVKFSHLSLLQVWLMPHCSIPHFLVPWSKWMACHQAPAGPDDELIIWIRYVGAGRHLYRAGTGLKHTVLKGSLPLVKYCIIKLKHKTRKPYKAALSIGQVWVCWCNRNIFN